MKQLTYQAAFEMLKPRLNGLIADAVTKLNNHSENHPARFVVDDDSSISAILTDYNNAKVSFASGEAKLVMRNSGFTSVRGVPANDLAGIAATMLYYEPIVLPYAADIDRYQETARQWLESLSKPVTVAFQAIRDALHIESAVQHDVLYQYVRTWMIRYNSALHPDSKIHTDYGKNTITALEVRGAIVQLPRSPMSGMRGYALTNKAIEIAEKALVEKASIHSIPLAHPPFPDGAFKLIQELD